MTHAMAARQITPDPWYEFSDYVDAVLAASDTSSSKAVKIKNAAARYAGECSKRALRAYDPNGPRFVERDNPLLPPPPLAVAAPSEPTTEFQPLTPDNPADAITTPAHDDSEPPCPNDDASTAGSSTTATPPAPGDAPDASQQPQRNASGAFHRADEDSAGHSPDASKPTRATKQPPAANAQAARSTAAHAAKRSPW